MDVVAHPSVLGVFDDQMSYGYDQYNRARYLFVVVVPHCEAYQAGTHRARRLIARYIDPPQCPRTYKKCNCAERTSKVHKQESVATYAQCIRPTVLRQNLTLQDPTQE
jgi:hypothetical protein